MAKQSLAIGLQTSLGQHWTLVEDYSDFTVVVEGVEFPCHRLILASCSTFFRLLLGNDMRERSENRAVLENIKKETFSVITRALYKGEDGLNSDNIIDVWYASHMLDISYLFEECERFVLSILDIENYIQFYHHAKMLCSKTVTSTIFTFILQNFEHFKSKQAFIHMSFEEIRALVEDCNLKVSSEEVVVDVILEWIKDEGKCEILEETVDNICNYSATFVDMEYRTDNDDSYELQNDQHEKNKKCVIHERTGQHKKEKLSILLSSARLCIVRIEYLESLLLDPLILSDSDAVLFVKKALIYHCNSNMPINSLVKFRKCHEMFNAMVFVKGCTLSFYSFEEKKEVISFEMSKSYRQISAFREKLLLCYNETSESQYYQYPQYSTYKFDHYVLFDVVSGNITLIAKIEANTGSYFLCDQNYIILFSPLETSERLIQHEDINKSFCLQLVRNENTIKFACIHRDHIFAFSDIYPDTQIHIYTLGDKVWVGREEISGPVDNIVSFHVDERTYILQRNGDLWVIENVEFDGFGFRKLTSLWNFQWCLRGAVCFSRELFLFGEYFKVNDRVKITTSSLQGVFDRIEVVIQSLSTEAVHMIVPRSIQRA